jgi:hypothetical protein
MSDCGDLADDLGWLLALLSLGLMLFSISDRTVTVVLMIKAVVAIVAVVILTRRLAVWSSGGARHGRRGTRPPEPRRSLAGVCILLYGEDGNELAEKDTAKSL